VLPNIDGLADLLARMAALEAQSADRIPVQQAWRAMRLTLEREYAKAEYADGELQRVERLVYAEPAFQHFNRVRRAAFQTSPRGKAKKRAANAKYHAKRNTPEYREKKRAADRARYQRRKMNIEGGGNA
jgi:hypothetical protein